MSTTDAIERNGLTECVYLYVRCWTCGELRAAVAEIPETRFMPCPSCHQEAKYKICAKGGTSRNLPFFEQGGYRLRLPWQGPLY